MNMKEIITKALQVPFRSFHYVLPVMFLVLYIIGELVYTPQEEIVLTILCIIEILVYIIIGAISLDITRKAINHVEKLPSFNITRIITDGIKYMILFIIYTLIPLLAVYIIAYLSGLFNIISLTVPLTQTVLTTNQYIHLGIIVLIGIILAFIAILYEIMAGAILAKTGSLRSALNIKQVTNNITHIGWTKYITLIIISSIISELIFFIGSLISIIPLIGDLILVLLIKPFIVMFNAYMYGLIYNESQDN
ncbi:hypothetical protein NL43_07910 [Methanosphaera sp. WGK6]|nr:hypothetical protein NL43_07910 [Methanosphaera sp. WGK6]